MITERLDARTMNEWEMQRAAGLPTLHEISEFLERKSRSLVHASNEQPRSGNKRKSNGERATHDHAPAKSAVTNQPTSSAGATPFSPCECCKGVHPLYRCTDFLGLSIANRQDSLIKWKLCLNCLRAGHESSKGALGPCYDARQSGTIA